MKPWTNEKIAEAYTYNWILFNRDDKPYVDAECYKCGDRWEHEYKENYKLPLYCPKCTKEWEDNHK